MRTFRYIALCLAVALCAGIPAQERPKTYQPKLKSIYHKGWIDFNKNGKMDVYENPAASVDDRVEDLLARMTMDEKTCQMVTLYGYKRILEDDLPTPEWKNRLWKDGVGAIDEHLNSFTQWGAPPLENPYVWPASAHAWALNEVQRFFVEETRLGIPVDFTNEGIRGVESYRATCFPTQLAIGHTWDRDLVRQIGEITAHEGRLLGYTNIYAPILDVGRDQRWGRYEEIYGESPFLVAELGVQMVRGMRKYNVAPTAKHFLAYSNNKGAREGDARNDPQMSPRELEMIHAYPFRRVIQEGGLLGVMCSYNDYDGFPVAGSRYWLTDRLRGEMGFRGYVVSDSEAVEFLYSKHDVAADMKDAVRQTVEAGLNVRCTFRSPDSFVLPLRELVAEGALSERTIDDRVRDILRVKFTVGLFDTPYQTALAEADRVVDNNPAYHAVALRASREALVLLKNADGLLPLDKEKVKTIAVCGPNADETSFALLHYGPQAVAVTSVLEGIRRKTAGKAEVLYAKGCELVDERWPDSEIVDYPATPAEQADIDRAVEQARRSDVVVAVLGGGERTCGENKSRSSLELPPRQLDLLKALHATGKPVVLVLINGRPLTINWADRFVPAILEAWYPGAFGGEAVADALFGDYNPGGKLTVTFPKSVGQLPFNFPAKPSSQADGYTKPGTRGNQSRVNGALYPFGHGLSYTSFEYADIRLSAPVITDKQDLRVTCTVTNTGERAGEEVAQVYLRDVLSSVTTYEKRLVGFERVSLRPGETKEVSFTIHSRDMRLLNADGHWTVEPGDFNVMIGASSEDIRLQANYLVISD
ncbi:MAG: glycoside hydrolase family 3 C-terminal domain-containing protein [Mediterranea sp.]|jgi:beta-glucosidase|nr:glycoside hydrolase family 3 C-terminal domain-containing protein [Mediterranea sp.]